MRVPLSADSLHSSASSFFGMPHAQKLQGVLLGSRGQHTPCARDCSCRCACSVARRGACAAGLACLTSPRLARAPGFFVGMSQAMVGGGGGGGGYSQQFTPSARPGLVVVSSGGLRPDSEPAARAYRPAGLRVLLSLTLKLHAGIDRTAKAHSQGGPGPVPLDVEEARATSAGLEGQQRRRRLRGGIVPPARPRSLRRHTPRAIMIHGARSRLWPTALERESGPNCRAVCPPCVPCRVCCSACSVLQTLSYHDDPADVVPSAPPCLRADIERFRARE